MFNIYNFCNCMYQDSKYNLFQMYDASYPHINIYWYYSIGLHCVFFHQIYIYICMIYASLIFLIHVFLQSCWTHLYLNLALFGTHTLLDKSMWVLQLLTHLSNLMTIWCSEMWNSWLNSLGCKLIRIDWMLQHSSAIITRRNTFCVIRFMNYVIW